jgi:hypothetical protein
MSEQQRTSTELSIFQTRSNTQYSLITVFLHAVLFLMSAYRHESASMSREINSA